MPSKRAIAFERQRQQYYRQANGIVRRALKSYRDEFEKGLNNCHDSREMMLLARKELRTDKVEDMLKKVYDPVARHFGTQSYNELKGKAINPGERIEPDYWSVWIDKMIKGTLGQRIKWITETTKEIFISTVDRISSAALDNGWGIDKVRREIMKDLNITERYRAERIARTEVIGASNSATHAGAVATGFDLDKEWIAYIDDKTRESHINLNGQTVDKNDNFSNGLEYPGDPSGEAEEVINCRCTVGYRAKQDSEFTWGREIN